MTAGSITLEKLKDRQGALRQYRRLLELEPAHEDAFVRARALLEEQKDDAGLLELVVARAAATANVRERAAMLKLQAELHRDRMRDSRSAVAALKQSIALVPDDLDAYLMLAPLEEEQRWWQGAADCYRKIAELTPGSDTSRTARLREAAIREDELGDREAARNILEELIIDDTDRQAARQMAQLCVRMGKHPRARELFLHAASKPGHVGRAHRGSRRRGARSPSTTSPTRSASARRPKRSQLATTSKDGVAALVKVYGERSEWNTFIRNAERICEGTHRGEGVVALRLALASMYSDRMSRPDLAAAQLAAARALAPNDATLTQRLAQLQLQSGHADRAVGEFRRALMSDPFNPSGAARPGRGGARAAARAERDVRRARRARRRARRRHADVPRRPSVSGAELQLLGVANPLLALVGELLRQLEPFAPSMIADVMGLLPRGDAVPTNHPTFGRCAQVAQTFGLPPFKLLPRSGGAGVSFVAGDGRGAVGRRPRGIGGRARGLRGGAPVLVRRRAPDAGGGHRRQRARRHRVVAVADGARAGAGEGQDAPRAACCRARRARSSSGWWPTERAERDAGLWADVQRRADRAALLVTGDPVTAMMALAGSGGHQQMRRCARCHDLMTWLLADEAWTVLAAFARSTSASGSSPLPPPRADVGGATRRVGW